MGAIQPYGFASFGVISLRPGRKKGPRVGECIMHETGKWMVLIHDVQNYSLERTAKVKWHNTKREASALLAQDPYFPEKYHLDL